ncbi:MAG: 30S ribosomal protein S20 [Deltaproteobacteria bacterium]|nr:30S ribosomal protein S20 [Deltaproteobacteria bacterium]MBN2687287.1 30S ribosomal protein S20 [Deltaproteobacteria bacterium]
MANHKSAEKRMKQSIGRRIRNVSTKSLVKTRIKSVLDAVDEKNRDQSQEELKKAITVIAKASSKGMLHKKNAARKISRLTRKVNALG